MTKVKRDSSPAEEKRVEREKIKTRGKGLFPYVKLEKVYSHAHEVRWKTGKKVALISRDDVGGPAALKAGNSIYC